MSIVKDIITRNGLTPVGFFPESVNLDRLDKAEAEIHKHIEKMIPAEYELMNPTDTGKVYRCAWNDCRDKMIENLKKSREERNG